MLMLSGFRDSHLECGSVDDRSGVFSKDCFLPVPSFPEAGCHQGGRKAGTQSGNGRGIMPEIESNLVTVLKLKWIRLAVILIPMCLSGSSRGKLPGMSVPEQNFQRILFFR